MPEASVDLECLKKEWFPKNRASLSFAYRVIQFLHQEDDLTLVALGDLDRVPGFPNQVRDVGHEQRIGAVHFEKITGSTDFNAFLVFSAGSGHLRPVRSSFVPVMPVIYSRSA
jgi:hypothetical protein